MPTINTKYIGKIKGGILMSKIIKSSRKKTVTRRDFLKGAAFGTLGVALGLKHLDIQIL